mmetsp:Transcript_13958/g.20281  ORF Transcript_13958/g.20281 Transcript_13958/m.20281 type:complete len:366 (-) Transcript_13958:1682-2779(-)
MADHEEMRAKLGRKLVHQYKEAEGLLREGSETEKAVDLLESALKETSESFPKSIMESASYAELLLSYGKALLQTLREQETEDALLGPEVLKSIEAKDTAEHGDQKEAEASKADADAEDELEDEEAGEEGAGEEEAKGEEVGDGGGADEGGEAGEGGDADEGVEDARDGDAQVSFELAWEQLENARVIFDSLSERKDHRLAVVLETLGDFSMENDDFDLAAKDYQAAIDVRLKIESQESRAIGGLHHSRYLALRRIDPLKAIDSLNLAIQLFNRRIVKAKEENRLEDAEGEASLRDEMQEEVKAFSDAIEKATNGAVSGVGFGAQAAEGSKDAVTVQPRKKARLDDTSNAEEAKDVDGATDGKTEG